MSQQSTTAGSGFQATHSISSIFLSTLLHTFLQVPGHQHTASPRVDSLTVCVTASITIMKSSGLSTEPWCTPFTPNHSLTDPPYDLILVLACFYKAITALTNHSSTSSFLMAHSTIFLGTLSKAFSRSTNAHHSFLCFPLYLSCLSLLPASTFSLQLFLLPSMF